VQFAKLIYIYGKYIYNPNTVLTLKEEGSEIFKILTDFIMMCTTLPCTAFIVSFKIYVQNVYFFTRLLELQQHYASTYNCFNDTFLLFF
jgi:hypothetical protein